MNKYKSLAVATLMVTVIGSSTGAFAYTYGAPVTDQTGLTEFDALNSVDLLARLIYSEARGEAYAGKQGVGHVAKNRKAYNIAKGITSGEFGGQTYASVILKPNQFVGMTTTSARQPDTASTAWNESLYIAQNIDTQYNPIGKTLWFNTSTLYNSRLDATKSKYLFPGSSYKTVTEKYVVGNHTFFRVDGYNW